jgi:hypothetical protein
MVVQPEFGTVGRSWSRIGLDELGSRPEFGTGRPEFGSRPELGTRRPELGTGRPELGTGRPELGTGRPEFGAVGLGAARSPADRSERTGRTATAPDDGATGLGTDIGAADRDRGTGPGTDTCRRGTVSASSALRMILGRVLAGRDPRRWRSARRRLRMLTMAPASSAAPLKISSTPNSVIASDRSPTSE